MSEDKAGSAKIKPDRNAAKPPKRITADYLHNSGLYYLQRFAATSSHFRRVMMRKVARSCGFHKDQDAAACAEMVEKLVENFLRAGLLDDATYLQSSVSSLRRRGLSAKAIEARLAAKGLGRDKVSAALDAYAEERGQDDAELAAAVKLARRRRIGPFGDSAPEAMQGADKAMAAMARAGFGYETARRALSMDRDEAELLIAASR